MTSHRHTPVLSPQLSRRALLGGAIGSLVLAACGGDDDKDEAVPVVPGEATAVSGKTVRLMPLPPSELGAPSVPPATPSTAAESFPLAKSLAPFKDFGTTAMPGAFPRQIRHAGGSTDIARAPQRVVGLDARAVEVAVALGVVPVGVASGIAGDPMLQQALAGVPTVGAGAEPDYEAIIALTPDLILGHDALDYGKLSAIAPTVFRTGTTATWRETFALFAQALGRETRTEEIVQAYEGRIRKLNAALPNPRPSISLIRVRPSDVWYYQRANYTASILTDLGFPRPPAQNVDDIAARNMSLETLQQYAPADLILVAADANAGGFTKDLLDGALWQSLDAVKKGNFLVVDAAWWINGRTYLAANSILDDIAEHFGVSG